MILRFRKAFDDEIDDLLETPEDLEWFLWGEEPDEPFEGSSLLSNILNLLVNERYKRKSLHEKPWKKPALSDECDIDKAWQAIHYILTETVNSGYYPRSFLLLGGDQIGTIDLGYGPARAFKSDQVKEIYDMLISFNTKRARKFLNLEGLTSYSIYVYNNLKPEQMDEDEKTHIFSHFERMKHFIETLSDENAGMIIYYT